MTGFPFTGLSLVVHIIAIILHKSLRVLRAEHVAHVPPKSEKEPIPFLELMIMITIFLFMLTGVLSLLRASVYSDYFVFKLIAQPVHAVETVATWKPLELSQGSPLLGLSPRMCPTLFDGAAQRYSNSLATYGLIHGATTKEELAARAGVLNYNGTREHQDALLFANLVIDGTFSAYELSGCSK